MPRIDARGVVADIVDMFHNMGYFLDPNSLEVLRTPMIAASLLVVTDRAITAPARLADTVVVPGNQVPALLATQGVTWAMLAGRRTNG